jgi:pre-mRNA-splicing factor ATP-dependent RNA helicase DHX16
MPPSGRTTENLQDLRLRSRQQYLEKREAEQLALLRSQVAEEEEELRNNVNLSEKERQEFARNKATLNLAEQRLNISDHLDGYQLPGLDVVEDKTAVLNSRNRDERYKSEFELFEESQSSNARGWTGKSSERVREEDYEFVFDESNAVRFLADAASRLDPDKQRLEQQLDAAEKKAKSIEDVRKSLPMYQYREQLLAAIQEHSSIVLVGETGSGKTTQLPQYLLESGANKLDQEEKMIICTQPRRVAAMSVAARVSDEVGCRLGTTVGYNVRFDMKMADETKILYCTDGMLLQLLLSDPGLHCASHLIIDEAHERGVQTDIILAIAKDLVKLRPSFHLIVSSATVNAQAFSEYLGDCPIFSVPGRMYPVDILYTSQPEANYLAASASCIWQIHVTQDSGDILVFLTGEDEIVSLADSLAETSKKLQNRVRELRVCPLYANLAASEQQKVFEATPAGVRKVILATNIAETSITIEGT